MCEGTSQVLVTQVTHKADSVRNASFLGRLPRWVQLLAQPATNDKIGKVWRQHEGSRVGCHNRWRLITRFPRAEVEDCVFLWFDVVGIESVCIDSQWDNGDG